jgi:hypothetical protein
VSPILEYLGFDPEFAKVTYDRMMTARSAWLEVENPKRAAEAAEKGRDYTTEQNTIGEMGGALGNVILGYRALFDPAGALKEANEHYVANDDIGKDIGQSGLIYYYAQCYVRLGTRLATANGSIATSAVYVHPGTKQKTFAAFNPEATPVDVEFFENGVSLGKLNVPPHKLVSAQVLK